MRIEKWEGLSGVSVRAKMVARWAGKLETAFKNGEDERSQVVCNVQRNKWRVGPERTVPTRHEVGDVCSV